MNFDLDEEQEAFADLAREFLDQECSPEEVREAEKTESGFSQQMYQKLADLGFLGLIVDEEFGGVAKGYTEVVLFYEEAGRHLLPGPYISTLIATEIIRQHGTPDQKEQNLPLIARGEAITVPAWLERSNDCGFEENRLTSTAVVKGPAYHLQGCKRFVEFGASATHLAWLAGTEETGCVAKQSTLFLFPVPKEAPEVSEYVTQGGGRVCDIKLELECPDSCVLGAVNEGWSVLSLGLELGRIATAAYAVGAAQKALDIAVNYAGERHQFGRPIGSFQAIQHQLATCRCLIEQARWLNYHAAGVKDGGSRATPLASMAKLASCRALRQTATVSSLTHGGYGFMEDYDIQLYFRRAKDLETRCGSLVMDREIVLDSELEKVDR